MRLQWRRHRHHVSIRRHVLWQLQWCHGSSCDGPRPAGVFVSTTACLVRPFKKTRPTEPCFVRQIDVECGCVGDLGQCPARSRQRLTPLPGLPISCLLTWDQYWLQRQLAACTTAETHAVRRLPWNFLQQQEFALDLGRLVHFGTGCPVDTTTPHGWWRRK